MQKYCDIKVDPKYFNLIQEKKKTVEGRIYRDKYAQLYAGDIIRFTTEFQELYARVLSTKRFDSFAAMLAYYGIKNCLSDVETLNEAVKIYYSFPNYQNQEQQFGVVGIEIEVCDINL